ncbi:hypothetical protein [Streptomyces sp. 8N616]|uniref:hypothetical protein n=1 Tax=Streptomyces sp. 8N616 TaxID=3457414 RepID=UPI003FCF8F98
MARSSVEVVGSTRSSPEGLRAPVLAVLAAVVLLRLHRPVEELGVPGEGIAPLVIAIVMVLRVLRSRIRAVQPRDGRLVADPVP